MLKKPLVIGIVAFIGVAALAVGAAVYAMTTAHESRSTGSFSVASESTSIKVQTYKADGTPDDTGGWCGQPFTAVGQNQICIISVQNTKTTGPVSYSMHETSYDNADTKNLGAHVNLRATAQAAMTSCVSWTGVQDGTHPTVINDTLVSNLPAFGDVSPGAQAGDRTLAAGQTEYLCLQFQLKQIVFGSQTGATFSIDADDD